MAELSWITADQQVVSGPLRLLAVTLVATSAGAADCTLYHGRGTDGVKLAVLRTGASTSRNLPLPRGVDLDQGLYVDVGSNVEGVVVVWEPLAS